jgi:hypothetical protein
MSEFKYDNNGRKGYCMMYFFIGFILLVITIIAVYQKNAVLEFPQ